ncbi:MAG: acyl carrier protein [Planctomycetota bacterium]|nr:acyl carrier protein [Planctomycetota bacterium]
MEDNEIISKVTECVANALGRDEEEVKLESVLSRDLEAESIDYLDITFQLEKAFGIKIEKDELFPQKIFQDARYVSDGVVTADGLAFLEQKLPYADIASFRVDPKVTAVPNLFTVSLLVNYVKTKIAA